MVGRWDMVLTPSGARRRDGGARRPRSTRSAFRAMAAADPSPAAVMTWARGLATLPATQTPGHAGAARRRPRPTQPSSSMAQPRPTSRSVFGTNRGRHEHRGAADDPPVVELDAGQPVVLDDQPAARCPRRRRSRGRPAARARRPVSVVGVREEHDVGRPLPDQLGVRDGLGCAAQHAERLVAHLVAVAVGAVQEVAAPPLARHPGCRAARRAARWPPAGAARQDRRRRRAGPRTREPAQPSGSATRPSTSSPPYDVTSSPAGGEQVGGRQAVAGEEAVHVRGGCVARRTGVHHRDPAPGPGQHQRGREAGGAAADHHHVVVCSCPQLCRLRRGRRQQLLLFPGTARRMGSWTTRQRSPQRSTRSGRG